MPLSTIFQLYRGGQFYLVEYPEKISDLPQVTDKLLSHNVVSSTPYMSGIRTHNVSPPLVMPKLFGILLKFGVLAVLGYSNFLTFVRT